MNEKLRQQFEEQLAYLPDINQQALKSFDWATELIAVGREYGLHIDQLDDLQIETMLVLVGLVQPDDYENELITRLAISPSEAGKIIETVNKRVFTPIHDYIVSGGPKDISQPKDAMQSVGFEMTNDETPITLKNDSLVRVGGGVHPVIPSEPAPLQFSPTEQPVVTQPTMTQPVNGLQKLQQVIHHRQQVIDTSLQNLEN